MFSHNKVGYVELVAKKEELSNSAPEKAASGIEIAVEDRQAIERAFNLIASVLRGLEVDVNMIDASLARLSPAQREKILLHLQQLKANKQRTHDLHYRYTELCLADSQQHFTNGVTPRERQLAERIMRLRERIADLIANCHDLLTKYLLIGKVQLPANCNKSLAAIKQLGNVLTEVFGGSFKYFNSGFKITGKQAIYIERNGEVYANNLEQLTGSLEQLAQRLAQTTEGKMLTSTPTLHKSVSLQLS